MGQERALCPSLLQTPQCLGLLESSSLGAMLLAGVGVAAEMAGVEAEVVVDLLVVAVDGSGTSGRGQVMSWDSCGQYFWILWYKYHCRVGESPDGVRRSGNSEKLEPSHPSASWSPLPQHLTLSWRRHDLCCWEVMKGLDPYQLVEVLGQKGLPVISLDFNCAI